MSEEEVSFGKSILLFLCALPYRIFCICYFVITLPRRFRHRRYRHNLPKQIAFRRLADVRVSALQACELARMLNEQDDKRSSKKAPSLFDLLESLWEEEFSAHWKIPTTLELDFSSEDLLREIGSSPLSLEPLGRVCVWAIDAKLRVFVAYCPWSKKVMSVGIPEDVSTALISGSAPDSRVAHFAYAVSVTPRKNDAPV